MAAEHAGVRALLLANGTVSGLLGSGATARVYPIRAPQNPKLPFAVLTRIGAERSQTFAVPSQITSITLQVDLFETTAAKLRTLADAVRVALNGYAGTTGGVVIQAITLDSERDIWEEAVEVYRCIQLYAVTFRESLS